VTTVLKLGGSVLTEKNGHKTVDDDALAAAADAIEAARPDRLVVVHGGGSFGHPVAVEHAVSASEGSRDAAALTEIHGAMGELNAAVCGALQERDVPALPVRPLSVAHRSADGALSFAADGVAAMLDEGFVPVAHGDVVAHAGRGATVASGDDIVVTLAERLVAGRVGVCTGVPGVLNSDDEIVGRIKSYDEVATSVSGSDATDVTGGMAAKVRALLELSMPAAIFGADDLEGFLRGELPGTTVG
jgi:isopentenyl phosphate kinase